MPVTHECLNCGKQFSTRPRDMGKYCGKDCMKAYEAAHGRSGAVTAERVTFPCKNCGTPFIFTAGRVASYRRTWGKDPSYCSRKCTFAGMRLSDAEWQVNCVQCGKPMPIQRRPGGTINRQKKLCSTVCRSKFRQERAPTMFGTDGMSRHKKRHGYMWISIPAYASPTGKKMEKLEHRWVMEKILGRALLKEETVHHIDGDRANNVEANLELFSSRHGPGQRVSDKVAWAIAILTDYPEFAREAGVDLVMRQAGHQAA